MPRPRSDIETRLVDAARARFLDQGVDGASLRKIAQDARTNIGMIYYYFKTKDDLFFEVIEDVYEDLLDDLTAALDRAVPFEERIRRLYGRLAAMSDREFEVVRIVLREVLSGSARLDRLTQRFSKGHLPLVMATLQDGVATGVLGTRHPLPILLVSTFAVGALPQVARRLIAQFLPRLAPMLPAAQTLANASLDILLHGIRKRD
jgi:AcrR family transcriptional regulator